MAEPSPSGSLTLVERSELLKAYRARWESLRWKQVIRLRSSGARCPQFAGKTLVYADARRPVLYYHRLPFGGAPESWWEDFQLGPNDRGIVKAFSAHFGTNLLAVLIEEWFAITQ